MPNYTRLAKPHHQGCGICRTHATTTCPCFAPRHARRNTHGPCSPHYHPTRPSIHPSTLVRYIDNIRPLPSYGASVLFGRVQMLPLPSESYGTIGETFWHKAQVTYLVELKEVKTGYIKCRRYMPFRAWKMISKNTPANSSKDERNREDGLSLYSGLHGVLPGAYFFGPRSPALIFAAGVLTGAFQSSGTV